MSPSAATVEPWAVSGSRGAVGSAVKAMLETKGVPVVELDLAGPRSVDVEDEAAVRSALREGLDRWGASSYRALVTCAASFPDGDGGLGDVTPEALSMSWRTNVLGLLSTVRACVPLLSSERSSIVLVGSTVAHLGCVRPALAYASSKAAVESIGRELAAELALSSVRVNMVIPGPLDSGLIPKDGFAAARAAEIPMGRLGTADEVAEVIVNLALTDGFRTGSSVVVDGGLLSIR